MTTERKGNAGASLFSLSRLIGAMTTAATKSNSGTRIAHNRPGAAGVIAANITATTQRKAISLRTENMVPTYCPMIHLQQCSFRHGLLGGHTFIARSVADEIARKLGNALVAPVLPFSPTDAFVKPQWPGTISVSTELYTKMNEAVVADMVVAGFKNIVLMGDHGGGQKQLEELADSLNVKYSPEGVHVLYCGAAYTKARDDFDAILKEKKLPVSNHAGIPDTSELMYLGGDAYLRKDKIVAGDPVLAPGQKRDLNVPLVNNGIQGDPRGSTPELGKRAIDIKIALRLREQRDCG